MKKTKFFLVLFLTFLLNSLFAQEITRHKTGLKHDFRVLLLEAQEHNFDVLHYQFEWKLDFNSQYIEGKATITSRSLSAINKISLHLADNMYVTQITQSQIPLIFTHLNDLIDIYLVRTFLPGEEFTIEISYHGFPQSGLNFSYHQNEPIIWSLDEPTRARNWFPSYDIPSDKATVEMQITVPDSMIVASNGTLINVVSNSDNTKTYVWLESYPTSTYLISVAATNYETFSDYYTSGSDTMEVPFYAYPEHFTQAQEDFSVTVPMIEFYSKIFGEYPFLEEKYGTAEIPGTTSMEHQTCTSYSSRLVTGTHQYDWVLAHELAHQWWGDLVTLADWADIWLNEGFATYSEALWAENLYGFDGLKAAMAEIKNIYLTRHTGPEHPIYNPPPGHLFCAIEYEKGACILHMLRFVVGENNFWEILNEYAQLYAYSNASTEDFQAVCEQIYGAELGWFFSQWIYEAGYPAYQFRWAASKQNRVRVFINQAQEEFPLFVMPIELKFILPSGTVKKVVWVDKKKNAFEFNFQEEPSDVLFDPDSWILCNLEDSQKKGKRKR
ncbi:MAG: M1 family metallopeptidase [Candidatus Aminicenantes bacterium]|nr:MAG: M1 family metallopeptidase [Candidatus Aminicenantes bacterium]